MRILILGATGFIGNNIFHALVGKHEIITGGRKPISSYPKHLIIDFSMENDWEHLLNNIDLVINAIGIIEGDFKRIQTDAPIEMYKYCQKRNIKVIHISAIGAEKRQPLTDFLISKKKTDEFLLKNTDAKVIYPGIVFGKNGKSARFFAELAQLPIVPLIKTTNFPSIHISQLTKIVPDIIDDYKTYPNQVFAISEPEQLLSIINQIKGRKTKYFYVPKFFIKDIFILFPKFKIGVFNKTTFQLLNQKSNYLTALKLEKTSNFINKGDIPSSNDLLSTIALWTVSFVWIWSGISSLISWTESMQLMNNIGASYSLSVWGILLGSFVDIILGISLLIYKNKRLTINLQLITMFAYMLILSIFAPEFWLHPYGVLIKNFPLIVLSFFVVKK